MLKRSLWIPNALNCRKFYFCNLSDSGKTLNTTSPAFSLYSCFLNLWRILFVKRPMGACIRA